MLQKGYFNRFYQWYFGACPQHHDPLSFSLFIRRSTSDFDFLHFFCFLKAKIVLCIVLWLASISFDELKCIKLYIKRETAQQ